MKSTVFFIIIILLVSSYCAYGSLFLPEYSIPTESPTYTITAYQVPTLTPFPDPTELTERVVETSLALTPVATNTPLEITLEGAACIPNNSRFEGTVTQVIDGATIEVDVDGRLMTVRYIGIDTSESILPDQPVMVFSEEAREKNKELVGGKEVILYRDISMTDGYGRLLAYVLTDQFFVNQEMIRQGYALSASYPPDVACSDTFQLAESSARKESAGLWSKTAQNQE